MPIVPGRGSSQNRERRPYTIISIFRATTRNKRRRGREPQINKIKGRESCRTSYVSAMPITHEQWRGFRGLSSYIRRISHASWAVHQVLERRLSLSFSGVTAFGEMSSALCRRNHLIVFGILFVDAWYELQWYLHDPLFNASCGLGFEDFCTVISNSKSFYNFTPDNFLRPRKMHVNFLDPSELEKAKDQEHFILMVSWLGKWVILTMLIHIALYTGILYPYIWFLHE